MSPKLREIELVYAPVLRHLMNFKIVLSCCIEAYINEVGITKLSIKEFGEFDKLSIIGKWLFIHQIFKLKKGSFKLGEEPLQGVSDLIRDRNKIVHYKSKPQKTYLQIPDFIDIYNLNPKECEKNLKSVKKLLRDFSNNWIGSNGPHWLKNKDDEMYRVPCFYMFNHEAPLTLYSKRVDKDYD